VKPPVISVELVYATRERQVVRVVSLPSGTTVAEAVAAAPDIFGAGNTETFDPGSFDLRHVGIWGRVADPDSALREGDRVEFLRRLTADPKDARRRREAVRRRKG
jgi:uncharacterized protein